MSFGKLRRYSGLRGFIRTGSIAVSAFIVFILLNDISNLLFYWLAGIFLGFMPFQWGLTDTQHAQLALTVGLADSLFLFILLKSWFKRRKLRFWRYMKKVVLVMLPLYLLGAIAISSYQFYKGQNGGDYSCSQEVSLSQAIGAAYPINTDTGGGSAFAIDPNGDLVTAYHVIQGAKYVTTINPDGSTANLKVVRVNPAYDLALLKYNGKTPDFLPLTDSYNIADQVYIIGWPENYYNSGEQTITSGVISRDISSQDADDSGVKVPAKMAYIQTDAAANPGDSGGPLVDTCGAVGVVDELSLNSDGSVQDGITYTINANTVKFALNLK